MRTVLALLLVVSATMAPSALAQRTPLDRVRPPDLDIVERFIDRDVVLEVQIAPDGALLSWRCVVSPHPDLCRPTAAVAAWLAMPTMCRDDRPDTFRLPVTFWLPEDYSEPIPDQQIPTDAYAQIQFPNYGSGPGPIRGRVTELGGRKAIRSRVVVPLGLPDSLYGMASLQVMVDRSGRPFVPDTLDACRRDTPAPICAAGLAAVLDTRFLPGLDRQGRATERLHQTSVAVMPNRNWSTGRERQAGACQGGRTRTLRRTTYVPPESTGR